MSIENNSIKTTKNSEKKWGKKTTDKDKVEEKTQQKKNKNSRTIRGVENLIIYKSVQKRTIERTRSQYNNKIK